MKVEHGEFVCIIGPNGAGKTTLLRLATGYLQPAQGVVALFGTRPAVMHSRERARKAALVPQSEHHVFGFTVRSSVMMGRYPHDTGPGFENDAERRIADEAMRLAELTDLADRPVGSLSGGEQHRVSIARALAQQTPLLLLDEPNAHLDIRHQTRLFDLLKELQTTMAKTVLCVTHDLNLASYYADRILLLNEGKIAAAGKPAQVLTPDNINRHFAIEARIVSEHGRPVVLPHPQHLHGTLDKS
jgi:iron complex transport system ATP-binding protein